MALCSNIRSISTASEFDTVQFPVLKNGDRLPPLEAGFARVILMRHGESVQNASSLIVRIPYRDEHNKYPLTQKGITQVTESTVLLLETLQTPLHTVCHSPLLRAKQSHDQVVEIWKVKRLQDKITSQVDERLVETNYGGMEGINGVDYKISEDKMKADLLKCTTFDEAVSYKMFRKTEEGQLIEQNMETGAEVIARTEQFIRSCGLIPNTATLGVTSNGLLKYMALKGYNDKGAFLRYNQIEVGNGAMTIHDTDGKDIKMVAVYNIGWSSK